jgi:ubiquinone biosynthesis protein
MFQTIRNTGRLLRIGRILARHRVLRVWKLEPSEQTGARIAAALQEMGPTFIKFGQAISTRSDLIGPEIAKALSQLQDRLPPFAGSIVHTILFKQFGKTVNELFAAFDDNAAAAASIAQVHFATLMDGSDVAVKVLRPGVKEAFARDIALFYWLAEWTERLRPEWRRFHIREIVELFEEMIRFELDLRFEASAAVTLRENLAGDEGFYVPKIYWDTTAEQVLTLERIRGIPIAHVEELKEAGHDLAHLVDIAAISFFRQVFRDGFFHADLHPGNLFVLPNGDIAVVDFGIMGRLDRKSRLYLAQILHGFLREDYYALAKVHFDAGFVPRHKSIDNFALALQAITKPIIGRKLADISVARLLGQLFTTAETFEMEVQPHLLLLQKNMMITEGVGRMLNPDINMWMVAEPLVEEWAKQNLGPKAQMKQHAEEAFSMLQRLPSLVKGAEDALSRVSGGGVRLHPDTLAAILAQRGRIHRDWMWFACVALAIFALAYIT